MPLGDSGSAFGVDALPPAVRAALLPLLGRVETPPVVAFDADGTLWRGDVGEDFLRYLTREGLLPTRLGDLGVYSEYEARLQRDPFDAYAFAAAVMEGIAESELDGLCVDFFHRRFRGRVFGFVPLLLDALRELSADVWLVSASPVWIVRAGALALQLDPSRVIAVSSQVEAGLLTRRVHQPVPCGPGKVAHLQQRQLKPALAAGNSVLDLPMLEYAERALVVAPHGEVGSAVVKAAQGKGWPIHWA